MITSDENFVRHIVAGTHVDDMRLERPLTKCHLWHWTTCCQERESGTCVHHVFTHDGQFTEVYGAYLDCRNSALIFWSVKGVHTTQVAHPLLT
jgi:hypothetical protein